MVRDRFAASMIDTHPLVPPVPERGDTNIECNAKAKGRSEDGGHVDALGGIVSSASTNLRGHERMLTVPLHERVVEEIGNLIQYKVVR